MYLEFFMIAKWEEEEIYLLKDQVNEMNTPKINWTTDISLAFKTTSDSLLLGRLIFIDAENHPEIQVYKLTNC